MTTVEDIAAWAVSLHPDEVPGTVVELARAQRRSVLGGMAASSGDRAWRRVVGAVESWSGDGPAPLIGTPHLVRVEDALYAAAAASVALDFDDYLCFGHTGHSAVLVPMLLAAETGAGGGQRGGGSLGGCVPHRPAERAAVVVHPCRRGSRRRRAPPRSRQPADGPRPGHRPLPAGPCHGTWFHGLRFEAAHRGRTGSGRSAGGKAGRRGSHRAPRCAGPSGGVPLGVRRRPAAGSARWARGGTGDRNVVREALPRLRLPRHHARRLVRTEPAAGRRGAQDHRGGQRLDLCHGRPLGALCRAAPPDAGHRHIFRGLERGHRPARW